MTIALVTIYVVATLVIGVVAHRAGRDTPDDYFLAGRGLGTVVLFFTIIATNFSAFFFLGFAGAGYRIGFGYYAILAFGTAFVAVAFHVIGTRVWRLGKTHGYITPPELIGDRLGSRPLKFLYLAVMVIFTMPYLALQPVGAGYLLYGLSDGAIPQFAGAALLTLSIVFYVFLGGMRSVALTDVVQGVLMFALMALAVLAVGNALGGVTAASERAFEAHPELFTHAGGGGFFTGRLWFSYMILWVLAVPMFPQVFMRFYVAQDVRSLGHAATIYPLVTATLFLGPVLLGIWGRLVFPGLEGTASDQILPMVMVELAPAWLSALIMVGAVAAFMSTMDSQLLALSSMITRDLYVDLANPQADLARQVTVGKVLVVALAFVGLALAYSPPETFVALATQAFTGLAVLFPTTVAALYWQKATASGCAASIVVGELMLAGFHYGWLPETLKFGFLPLVPILAVATAIIVATGRSRVGPANAPK